MPEPQLTPDQKARLDKLAARAFRWGAALAGGSWLLLAAAIWFASWRLFGLGLLVAVLAVVGMLAAAALHNPAIRKRTARRLNGTKAGDFGEVSDDHGNAWPRCSADCDLHVVRPGRVQCRCEPRETSL